MVREKFGSWTFAALAGAPCCTSEVDEAESINMVVLKCLGLAQLGLVISMVFNKLITAF